MKAFALVLAGGLVLGGAAAKGYAGEETGDARSQPYFSDSASHARTDLASVVGKYKLCLTCGNEGVIGSALAHIAWMKIMKPDADLAAVREDLNQLAVAGTTPVVRYKAYLTFLVFDNPGMFARLKAGRYEDSDEFYAEVANTLRASLLGFSDRKYVREQ